MRRMPPHLDDQHVAASNLLAGIDFDLHDAGALRALVARALRREKKAIKKCIHTLHIYIYKRKKHTQRNKARRSCVLFFPLPTHPDRVDQAADLDLACQVCHEHDGSVEDAQDDQLRPSHAIQERERG